MELLSVIRRWHYRDHFSIREISRRTGLSRNTVRKYLRSDTVEPKFNIPDRPSKLDPYADKLSQMLRQEAGKWRKQKRTVKQLHADLATLGYDGSYNRVAAFARDWKAARQQEQKTCGRGAFVPLAFLRARRSSSTGRKIGRSSAASGPNCRALTSSSPTAAPSFSAPILSRPTRCCSTPHNHAFRVLVGVPRQGIYDNMRTAVDKVGRGKGAPSQRALLSHGPATSYLRGGVLQSGFRVGEGADREESVQDARHRFWQPAPHFPSLDALNDWLETRCRELWALTPHGSQAGTVADVRAEEAHHLMPLSRTFDGFVEYAKRVASHRHAWSIWTAIATACRRLSPIAPSACASIPNASLSPPRDKSSANIAAFLPAPTNAKSTTTVFDWRHYLAVIQRKPGALRNGAPFAERLPACLPGPYNSVCSEDAGRRPRGWWRSSPWFSSTTSKPCSPPSNWRWRPARQRRRIF